MWELLRLGWSGYLGEGNIRGTSRTTPGGPVKPAPQPGQGSGAAASGARPPADGAIPRGLSDGDGATLRALPDAASDPVTHGFPSGKPGAGLQGPPNLEQAPRDDAGLQALEALIRSAQDPDQSVSLGAQATLRQTAASTSSPDVLRRLAQLDVNQFNSVLMAVAENTHTPENVLRNLAATGDPFLVEMVAGNRSAPPDLLDQLVRNPSSRVSANNLQTLREVVQEQAAGNLSEQFAKLRAVQLREVVQEQAAGNQRLLPQTLEYLAEHGNPRTRLLVAQNHSTPTALLERMARQPAAEEQGHSGEAIRGLEARVAELERQMNAAVQQNQSAAVTELAAQLRESKGRLETLRAEPQIRAAALEELARRAGGGGGAGPTRAGKR